MESQESKKGLFVRVKESYHDVLSLLVAQVEKQSGIMISKGEVVEMAMESLSNQLSLNPDEYAPLVRTDGLAAAFRVLDNASSPLTQSELLSLWGKVRASIHMCGKTPATRNQFAAMKAQKACWDILLPLASEPEEIEAYARNCLPRSTEPSEVGSASELMDAYTKLELEQAGICYACEIEFRPLEHLLSESLAGYPDKEITRAILPHLQSLAQIAVYNHVELHKKAYNAPERPASDFENPSTQLTIEQATPDGKIQMTFIANRQSAMIELNAGGQIIEFTAFPEVCAFINLGKAVIKPSNRDDMVMGDIAFYYNESSDYYVRISAKHEKGVRNGARLKEAAAIDLRALLQSLESDHRFQERMSALALKWGRV